MIRKHSQLCIQKNQNMRGGSGQIVLLHLLQHEQDELYGKGRLFSRMVLNPGCSVGFHVHENEMECYHILKGRPEYNDNGHLVFLEEGDVTLTQSGEGHGISNPTGEPVELIALILYK